MAQVGVHHAAHRLAGRGGQHLGGAIHRVRRHGRARSHGLEHHQAKGIGPAGEHEHVGRRVHARQLLAGQHAQPAHLRVAGAQLVLHRADAAHHLGAGQVQLQKGLDVLLVRHTADEQVQRPRDAPQRRVVDGLGLEGEQLRVDAVRPFAQVGEAALRQPRRHAARGHHHARRRPVEVAEEGIAPGQRQPDGGVQDLGELGVEGRGEGPAAAQAMAPRGPAQRAFGGDVHGVGLRAVQQAAHLRAGAHGQVDAGVAGARPRPELARLDDDDLVAAGAQRLHQLDQRGHHAVDLRLPGVGHQSDFHGITSKIIAACA